MAIKVKVRNIRTSQEYFISEDGWNAIVKQGWEGRYQVLDRRTVVDTPKSSYIPAEIGAAATAAASALEAGQQDTHPGGNADDADASDATE